MDGSYVNCSEFQNGTRRRDSRSNSGFHLVGTRTFVPNYPEKFFPAREAFKNGDM